MAERRSSPWRLFDRTSGALRLGLVTAAALAVGVVLLAAVQRAGSGAAGDAGRPASRAARCEHPRIRTGSLAGTVRITTIRNGARVPRAVDPLRGTYRNLAATSRVWIFLWSAGTRRFYPQTHERRRPADLQDGRLRSAAFFGGRSGERYDVIAIVSTPLASRSIDRVIHASQLGGGSRSLRARDLPAGMEEKHCVAVIVR